MKHSWAHEGMAVEAMGLQSEVVAAEHTLVVSELPPPPVLVEVGAEEEPPESVAVGLEEVTSVSVAVGTEVASQGVVGLAVTHSQRAATLERTWRPVAIPHPWVTHPMAAPWMTADEEHWHA